METSNNEEIIRIINNRVDIFEFMGLDKTVFSDSEYMFTKEYLKELKKKWKENNKKYHTDKFPNASEEQKRELEKKFSMNQIIYQILISRELYDLYLKTISEVQNTHNDLRDNFIRLRDEDIKAMIREATGGKTYEELCIEKEIQHGIDRTLVGKLTVKETNHQLNNLIDKRNNVYEDIKKNTQKMEINGEDKFSELFNKKFNEQINRNIVTQEIQTYNDANSLFNFEKFDYSNMFDNNFSSMNESFDLLSTNIPEQYIDSRSMEEKLKAYHDRTKEYENLNKGVKTESNLVNDILINHSEN